MKIKPIDRGPTYSEEYRAQCEAREFCMMAEEERDVHLEYVEKKRGIKAKGELVLEARKQWKVKRDWVDEWLKMKRKNNENKS